MIGVYKITNNVTGETYIGASVNIRRRFMEHKTPNAYGNDRLHGDMQRLGIEQFSFDVIEECDRQHLQERELFHIRTLKPSYNFVGNKKNKEQRKRVSEGVKKWWAALPEDTRKKIISENLKPPKVGHPVSAETREKLRRAAIKQNSQPVRCIETGEVFPSISAFEKSVNACTGTCSSYFAERLKSVKGYHVEKCRD